MPSKPKEIYQSYLYLIVGPDIVHNVDSSKIWEKSFIKVLYCQLREKWKLFLTHRSIRKVPFGDGSKQIHSRGLVNCLIVVDNSEMWEKDLKQILYCKFHEKWKVNLQKSFLPHRSIWKVLYGDGSK